MKVETQPEDVAALVRRLDAQGAEIQRLRALFEPDGKAQPRVRSRRDLLKLAGVAVMGAAGAAAMRAVPAAAANGDAVTVGGSFTGTTVTSITNSSDAGTALVGIGTGRSSIGLAGSSTDYDGAGVYGSSAGIGVGVFGHGAAGTGGLLAGTGGSFEGGRASIHLSTQALMNGMAGPPVSGYHSLGDIWVDGNGVLWAGVTNGTPGVFAPLQTGGANLTHFVKVSNKQYTLAGSDGLTWVDVDSTGLAQVITPLFNAQAVISINTDLWTADAGFNQDIGIFISGGAYGAGQIVAWKESGGFAGTFSPNAAFLETTQPLVAGTTYTIKVRWKTNKNAAGATIFAGAGPLPAGSAGGGVAGQYSPTRLATHLVVDVPSPITLHIPANDATKTPPPPVAPLLPRP